MSRASPPESSVGMADALPVTPRLCISCTDMGMLCESMVPWPRRPLPPNPQVSTKPLSLIRHVCWKPQEAWRAKWVSAGGCGAV